MSLPNVEQFNKTACFFQPKGIQQKKKLLARPLVPLNMLNLRQSSISRKLSLDQLLKNNGSCKSLRTPQFTNDAATLKNIALTSQKQLNLSAQKWISEQDEPRNKKNSSPDLKIMEIYQQHRRTNSAHISEYKPQVQADNDIIVKHNFYLNKLKQYKASTITQSSDLDDQNKLHYEIYSKSKIISQAKPIFKHLQHFPTELNHKDPTFLKKQTLAEFTNIRFPTLFNEFEHTRDYRLRGKTFLQSKAQMNMVHKLFKN